MSFAYIGRAQCGCIVVAMVDDSSYKKDMAREISKWIKEGLKIERVTDDYVRENFKHCPHGE